MTTRDEEASDWFARMRAPDAERHRAAFEAWRSDPDNRAAFAEAESDWLAVEGLAPEDRIIAGPVSSSRPRPPVRWAVAAALLLSLGLGAAWFAHRASDGVQVAKTAAPGAARAGEQVRLADGSLVELTDGARIEARIDGTRRDIVLLGGRARFIVAHDAVRPFVVRAGESETTALGTVFEVDFRTAHPLVHLVSGSVDVRAGRGKRSVRLTAGESAEVSGNGARRVAAEVKAAAGMRILQAEGLALGEVIARANRLGGAPIALADPALATRRVSGRFDISDTGELAPKIAAALDLDVAKGPNGPVLTAKAKKTGE